MVLPAVLMLTCAGCRGDTTNGLSLGGVPGGVCQSAINEAHWQKLQRNPTEIGLDYVTVTGDEPIRIESVSLVGATGGLRVVEASLAPGGGVGAFTLEGTQQTHLPTGFRSRLMVPGATLTKGRATPAELRANPSANAYQIVVGVIPTTAFGGARAAKVTYRVGNRSGTVVGRDFVIVSQRPTECSLSDLASDHPATAASSSAQWFSRHLLPNQHVGGSS